MKIQRKGKIASIILCMLTICISIGSCDLGSVDSDVNYLSEDWDAWVLGTYIRTIITASAPYYTSITWIDHLVTGNEGGTALVNGSINEDSDFYEYNNVVIDFDDFCENSGDCTFSGTMTIDGRISQTGSYPYTSYNGVWSITGTLDISGTYDGRVIVDITFGGAAGNYIAGTITSNGTAFDATDYY